LFPEIRGARRSLAERSDSMGNFGFAGTGFGIVSVTVKDCQGCTSNARL